MLRIGTEFAGGHERRDAERDGARLEKGLLSLVGERPAAIIYYGEIHPLWGSWRLGEAALLGYI